MTTQLLIDAIMRQTIVLVAQLATARGARTPLSDIAGQVFSELANELHRQGVSRKVAADMFGLALRTYRRRVARFAESQTAPGRSLWEAVYEFLADREVTNQPELLTRFVRDDQQTVRGVLQDLVESGLVFRAGRGDGSSYRVATRSDLEHAHGPDQDTDSADMLVWAVVYRVGPIARGKLSTHIALPAADLDASVARLLETQRLVLVAGTDATYRADTFVAPLGAANGREAAVFDHFQAVVTTIGRKLAEDSAPTVADRVGGSTYTFEVWPGHPLEHEVFGQLTAFRDRLGRLRDRVLEHNHTTTVPDRRSKVVVYGGQSFIEHEADDDPTPDDE